MVRSKICVETDENAFLCTDDAAKARSAAIKGGNDDYFNHVVDYGVTQKTDGTNDEQRAMREVIHKMKIYFRDDVFAKSSFDDVREHCKNKHELCAFWASMGECERNPSYMQESCPAVCRSCHLLKKQF